MFSNQPKKQMQKQPQNNVEVLIKEIQRMNKPVEKDAIRLVTQIEKIKQKLNEKIQFYEQILSADNHKKLDKLYDESISLLEGYAEKQSKTIQKLKQMNGKGESWQNLHKKVAHEKQKMDEVLGKDKVLQNFIRIETQLKELQEKFTDWE